MGNESSMVQGEHARTPRKNSRGSHHLSTPSFSSSASNSPATRHGRHPSISSHRVDEAALKFNETGDFGLTLAETLSLSAYQQQLLNQTWPKVVKAYSSNEGPVAVFQVLGTRNPNARNLFQRVSIVDGFTPTKAVDQREHGRLLGDLFQFAVQKLNAPALEVREKCSEIGHNHIGLSGRGMTPRMWEDLGDCLIEFVCKAECVRKSRESSKAWAALVSFMIDNMKSGYQAELRRRLSVSPRVERPRDEIEREFHTHAQDSQGRSDNHNDQKSYYPDDRQSPRPQQSHSRRGQPSRRQSERNLVQPRPIIHPDFHSDNQLYGGRESGYLPPAPSPSPPPSHLRRSYNSLVPDNVYATEDRYYQSNSDYDRRYSHQEPQPQPPYLGPPHGYQGQPSNGHLLPTDDRGYYEEQMYYQQQRQPRVHDY